MDFQFIEKLVKLMKKENLSEVQVNNSKTGNSITLKANTETVPSVQYVPELKQQPLKENLNQTRKQEDKTLFIDVKEINSPFVGTFYSAPSPSSQDFVRVGSSVKKGQTLCIIEAMKMMNEIEAEVDGIVAEILIKNENPVEYNQVLFKIKI